MITNRQKSRARKIAIIAKRVLRVTMLTQDHAGHAAKYCAVFVETVYPNLNEEI
jgi:hypothetical protein